MNAYTLTLPSPPPSPPSHSQRAHLLERTEQLQKGSDRLEEGIRIAKETEEIGMDVMDTLQRDRETIQRMRGRVRSGEEWGGGDRREEGGGERRREEGGGERRREEGGEEG